MNRIQTVRDLANLIRGRRTDLGLTQAELARRARVSRSWLVEFEANRKPTAEIGLVLQVLDSLGVVLLASADGPTRTPGPAAGIDLDEHLARYHR